MLTAVNVFIFLKLKQASEQMLQMAFPGARDMNDALGRMQQMMKGASRGGSQGFGHPGQRQGGQRVAAGGGGGGKMDSQLKAAMEMLQKMQKTGKR